MPFQKYVPPVIPPLPRPHICRICKVGFGTHHSLYYHLVRSHRNQVTNRELERVLDGMRTEYREAMAHKRAHESTWDREHRK
jgi:hypothetical protein